MRILDVVTGIGYGHSIRQKALLDYFRRKGDEILVAGYDNSYNYFKNNFPCIEIRGPRVLERIGKWDSFKIFFYNLRLFYDWFYFTNKQLKISIKAFKPDVIISDFELMPLYLGKEIPHFLMFNFDVEEYKNFVKENKRFFVQKFYIDWHYKRAKKINCPIIIPSLLGGKKDKDYCYVNPIIRELPKVKKEDYVIVMLGGSFFGVRLLYKLLEILPEFKEEFVVFAYNLKGKDFKNVNFLEFREDFLEYLMRAKAIITMGGHTTLSECVVLKKPSLIFPISNSLEQSLNAYVMEKNKIGVIGNANSELKELREKLEEFFSSLGKLEKNLNKLNVKGNGAEQVYKIIKEKI